MYAGKVIGRVVCSSKYETLEGKKLLLVQPMTWDQQPKGGPIVAVDAVGAGGTEFVFYVCAREAAMAFDDVPPIDATILGIIDGVNLQDWTMRPAGRKG